MKLCSGSGSALRTEPRPRSAQAGRRTAAAPRRRAQQNAGPPRRRHWGWAVAQWAAVAAIWGLVVLVGLVAWFAYDLPDINRVAAPERRAAITVLAADGAPIARYGDLTGETVRVSELPAYLPWAVLAIEDRRF